MHLGVRPRRRPATLAAAALLATGVMVLSTASASASTSSAQARTTASTAQAAVSPEAISNCGSGRFCAWKDYGFSGTEWIYNYRYLPLRTWLYVGECTNHPQPCSGANDSITSFYNNRVNYTYVNADYYTNPSSYSVRWCAAVRPGAYTSNLNTGSAWWPIGYPMNDTISAVRLTTVKTVTSNCDEMIF